MIKALDTSMYTPLELQNVIHNIRQLNLLDKDLKKINMVQFISDTLQKLNNTNAILRTPELYCFLGLILVCREFLDNDGKPFDVLISSIYALLESHDPEVKEYATQMNSYLSNIW